MISVLLRKYKLLPAGEHFTIIPTTVQTLCLSSQTHRQALTETHLSNALKEVIKKFISSLTLSHLSHSRSLKINTKTVLVKQSNML